MPKGGVLNSSRVTQKDLYSLEGWAKRNLTKLNKDKHDALSPGKEHPTHQYNQQLSDLACWKESRDLVDNDLDTKLEKIVWWHKWISAAMI